MYNYADPDFDRMNYTAVRVFDDRMIGGFRVNLIKVVDGKRSYFDFEELKWIEKDNNYGMISDKAQLTVQSALVDIHELNRHIDSNQTEKLLRESNDRMFGLIERVVLKNG